MPSFAVLFLALAATLPAATADTTSDPARTANNTDSENFRLFNECRPIFVDIGQLTTESRAFGLHKEDLRIAAETRLRVARLLASEDDRGTSGLFIDAIADPKTYSIEVNHSKPLEDRFGHYGMAVTKSYARSGTNSTDTGFIFWGLSELMDEFLLDYLRVNTAACDPPLSAWSEPPPHEDRVYRSDDVTTKPRLLYNVGPEYSEEARHKKLQGAVLLSVEVWPDGRAHNIRVLEGVGMGLDKKAIEAVQQWRFPRQTQLAHRLGFNPSRLELQTPIAIREGWEETSQMEERDSDGGSRQQPRLGPPPHESHWVSLAECGPGRTSCRKARMRH